MLLANKKAIFFFLRRQIYFRKNKIYSEAEFQEIRRQKTTLPPVLNFTGI